MKKTKSIFLIFLTFCFIIGNGCKQPFGDSFSRNFLLKDTASVMNIRIVGKNDVNLSKETGKWLIDDTQEVNITAVNNFLFSFMNFEKLGIIRQPDDNLLWMDIYITARHDYHYLFSNDEKNAYITLPEKNEIYRIGIKGMPEVHPAGSIVDSVSYWRNPSLISIYRNEILKICAYPDISWGKAFIIEQDGDEIILSDLQGSRQAPEGIDKEKLDAYLGYFHDIYFEKEYYDSVRYNILDQQKSFFHVELLTAEKDSVILDVYPSYLTDGEKDDYWSLVKINNSKSVFLVNNVYLDLMFECMEGFKEKQ